MLRSGLAVLAAAAAYPAVAAAQQSGWTDENQVNATMCYWEQPRGEASRASFPLSSAATPSDLTLFQLPSSEMSCTWTGAGCGGSPVAPTDSTGNR